ncbi:hypothetical protein F4780DRAFT_655414 [Xylariomycetidae sp. FL0641]|nr:hypothetical protein F4780DRAFT_655414 [Xylariomycetidae sp. FL0641]
MADIHIPGFVGHETFSIFDRSHMLGKRQNGCVQCLDAQPQCPDCKKGESCTITVPMDCQHCPQAICTKDDDSSSSGSSDKPNAGAIAGGVIGGVVVIALLTYLVWRFFVKNKRAQYEQEEWRGSAEYRTKEGMENDFASRRSQRESTHTVHSIASTVLTRASNIIQIAYIPGVTNRATPTSPTLLVPPVPPIPLAHAESGNSSPYDDQHFFVPGDLRDSTYSGFSNFTDRTSVARSYAPRSSVASTIYGKNAVISPLPAQKGNFLKPSIVSVKSRGASDNSSGTSTPPVPTVDYEKYDGKPPPSPTFSIGATFFKNASASTATTVRPQVVSVGSGSSGAKTVDVKSSKASSPTVVGDSDSPEPLVEVSEGQQERDSTAVTIINDNTPTTDRQGPVSPFLDPPEAAKGHHKKNSSLSAVMEDFPKPASGAPKASSPTTERNRSPFSDEHAVRD